MAEPDDLEFEEDDDLCLAFEVVTAESGLRLDRFLADRAEAQEAGLSRTRLKSLIENGAVSLDGAGVKDPAIKVKAGQKILLRVPPAGDPLPRGETMALAIRFEDAHLIVLEKPAGLVVHPAPGHATGTLVNGLIAHCGAELSGIGGVRRPGIVHRLDKDTSGLIVVAKSDRAHQGLAAIFADHGRSLSLTRDYLAFVWGVPERPAGTIATALARHKSDREKMAVAREGREAVTHWELREVYKGAEGAPVASLLCCSLETGRTHQIRVHLAHIGHPVLGDPLYGRGFRTKAALLNPEARAVLAGLDRQALHAATLGFIHPITGRACLFESALPPELQRLHDALLIAEQMV
ncbi:MAG TPA: RluA family pseudouridine synthase [Methylovirgula sp.]|nr:RluA family pseudouridine synthase [Methylovirgula sp.]